VRGFDSPAGKGAIGMVERRRVALGNARFLNELNIATDVLEAEAERQRTEGASAVFVAIDGKAAGVIAIADPIKDRADKMLAALRAEGIRIVMLTGDNRTTATAVGKKPGITEIEAEGLPDPQS